MFLIFLALFFPLVKDERTDIGKYGEISFQMWNLSDEFRRKKTQKKVGFWNSCALSHRQ